MVSGAGEVVLTTEGHCRRCLVSSLSLEFATRYLIQFKEMSKENMFIDQVDRDQFCGNMTTYIAHTNKNILHNKRNTRWIGPTLLKNC